MEGAGVGGLLNDGAGLDEGSFDRAFGELNRRRLIADHLDAVDELTPGSAWLEIYRLLLWINPTIGLAHCYENDKCQPGRPWYSRSLAFHAWVAAQMETTPGELWRQIDVLFRQALPGLTRAEEESVRRQAEAQRQPFAHTDMPLPGDDPDLAILLRDLLGSRGQPSEAEVRRWAARLHAHFGVEKKRNNMLGRGFEDAVDELIQRLPGLRGWTIQVRPPLRDVPGFGKGGASEKEAEPDLALRHEQSDRRILVTAKWSFRADRERQFDSDFADYVRRNEGRPFEHILLTNEFDAARLSSACSRVSGSAFLFSNVVHVQPQALRVVYPEAASVPVLLKDPHGRSSRRRGAHALGVHLDSGRLISLAAWLDSLEAK